MKKYALKTKEDLAVEIYMPSPEYIPSMDYCFHAADWALCFPLHSKARSILNTAEGLAEATMSQLEWIAGEKPRTYFRFEFRDNDSLRVFWTLVNEYL